MLGDGRCSLHQVTHVALFVQQQCCTPEFAPPPLKIQKTSDILESVYLVFVTLSKIGNRNAMFTECVTCIYY
jgi:hypothetical protein